MHYHSHPWPCCLTAFYASLPGTGHLVSLKTAHRQLSPCVSGRERDRLARDPGSTALKQRNTEYYALKDTHPLRTLLDVFRPSHRASTNRTPQGCSLGPIIMDTGDRCRRPSNKVKGDNDPRSAGSPRCNLPKPPRYNLDNIWHRLHGS